MVALAAAAVGARHACFDRHRVGRSEEETTVGVERRLRGFKVTQKSSDGGGRAPSATPCELPNLAAARGDPQAPQENGRVGEMSASAAGRNRQGVRGEDHVAPPCRKRHPGAPAEVFSAQAAGSKGTESHAARADAAPATSTRVRTMIASAVE